jgi:hypothetical protein
MAVYCWKWISRSIVSPNIDQGKNTVDAHVQEDDLFVHVSQKYFETQAECIDDGLAHKPVWNRERYLLIRERTTPSKFPQYAEISKRLTTFTFWPKYMYPRPEQLSEAGFFYVGPSDKVRCYDCGLAVHEWKPTDNAREEHMKFTNYCHHIIRY